MDAQATEHADVVVVGAGPTGLLLAGDLAEAGVRVLLLERRAGQSNLARAFAVHARTMEQLQIRGVADELAATGTTIDALVLYGRAAIDLSRLPSRYPSLLITPQSRTEEVLTRRLHRLGGSIVDGSEVDRRWPRTRTGWTCACAPWMAPNGATGRPTWSARTASTAPCAPRWACPTPVAPWCAR